MSGPARDRGSREGTFHITGELRMALAYDDLIEPVIVRQESKSRFYCMCGRTKNFPFCDGSHKVTSITPP